ncbi:hypothetical protein GQ457_03G016890 [Hibiscus cannabinus]
MHGRSESALKKHNWALIDRLRDNPPLPWLLGGDFNEILTFSEKQGGNRKPHHQLTDFHEYLLRNDLADCKPSRAWSDYSPNSDHHFILLDTVAPPHAPEARGKDSIFRFDDCLRQWQCTKCATEWGLEVLLAAKGELSHMLKVQEAYWAQRSRVLWLSAGDQNTSFFHAKASARKKKNAIMGLYDCNGYWQTSTNEVLRVASDYFVSLFSANPSVDAPAFLEHITPSVTADMNSGLLASFTAEEVIAAFRDINPRKSPGIDGLPSGFFRQHWDILGEDFVSLCLDLLQGNTDMASVNETVIVLIPKVDKPTSMRQLRPISLCTVIYKTVSKVLVNRGNRKPQHQLTRLLNGLIVSFADNAWFLNFSTFRAWSEYSSNSDHHLILLDIVAPPPAPEARGKDSVFRFDDCWAREPDCISMVQSLWAHSTGSFADRLATISEGLRHWQCAKPTTDWERIPRLKSEINRLSSRRLSPQGLEVLLAAKGELCHLLKFRKPIGPNVPGSFGFRLVIKYFLFHAKASAQKKKCDSGLYGSNGCWRTSTTEVLRVASDYFVSLFSANPLMMPPLS